MESRTEFLKRHVRNICTDYVDGCGIFITSALSEIRKGSGPEEYKMFLRELNHISTRRRIA